MKTSNLLKPKLIVLIEKYQALKKEAFELSLFNSGFAEKKYQEAQLILEMISKGPARI